MKITANMKNRAFIIAILLFSLAVRAYKIDSNLPNTYWHDENNYIESALRFGTGNFRPHTFQHGMLFPLTLFVEYGAYFVIKTISIKGYTAADFLTDYVINPTNFYMIGRVTAALFGMGCVLLVYLIGLRLYNKRTAWLASLFFSLSLVPLMESRYTKADPVVAFLILLAFLNARRYALSAFLIGLATAAKLYAGFAFSFIIAAHLLSGEDRKKYYKLMIGALFLILGFIAANPYIVVDPNFFYNSVISMQKEMTNPAAGPTWAIFFKEHLKNVTGSRPLEILIVISSIFFIVKRSGKAFMLLAYPAVFYLWNMWFYGFAHYLIPVIPFLLIIASAFLDTLLGITSSKRYQAIVLLIILLTIAPCLVNMARYLALCAKPDTRTIALDWVEGHMPSGSSILSEGYIGISPIQVPQIKGDLETLKDDLASVKSGKGRGGLVEAEIEYAKKHDKVIRYRIFKTAALDIDYVNKIKSDYVILSSFVDMNLGEREYLKEKDFNARREALYGQLESDYVLVQKISPYPEMGYAFPVFLVDDFKRLEGIDVLKDMSKLRQGPEIKIYSRKSIALKGD